MIKVDDIIIAQVVYRSGDEPMVRDGRVVYVDGDTVVLNYLYGYKSVSDTIHRDKVIAKVDETVEGSTKVLNYNGKLVVLNEELLSELASRS